MAGDVRGSNWLKCDLHVHSPASFFHNYGDKTKADTWEKFLSDLEALPPEFRIIGINDYLTIDGYNRVAAEKKNGRLKNIDCILPVVEFRINRFAGEGKTKRINYHVIFSDKIDPKIVETQFLNALSAKYTLEAGDSEPTWSASISDDSFIQLGNIIKKQSPDNKTLQAEQSWQVGFNNFNVDYDALLEILDRPVFRGTTITALGKSEWDEYRWEGGGAAEKRTIINNADLVFISCESVAQHQRNVEALRKANVNSILLDCSDAHDYSSSSQKDRIGNCHTWLKIEPTFAGLRQILFEPDSRISVSEIYPDTKAPYQVIEAVCFRNGGNHFQDEPIYLSPYLNSIVGGKSTGKSLLAGLIVKSCDPEEFKRRKGEQKSEDGLDWVKQKEPALDFEVLWKDSVVTKLSDASITRKVSYFPQHYLNSKINDRGVNNKELNKIIRIILAQTTRYAKAFEEYGEAVQAQDTRIAADCSAFEGKIRDLRELKHQSQEKGKSADIQANIDKLREELSDLQKQFGLSEEELKQHQSLADIIKATGKRKATSIANLEVLAWFTEENIRNQIPPEVIFEGGLTELVGEAASRLAVAATKAASAFSKEIVQAVADEIKLEQANLDAIVKEITEAEKQHAPILEKTKKSAPLREKAAILKQEEEKLDGVKTIEAKIIATEAEVSTLADALKAHVREKLAKSAIVSGKIEEQPFAKGDDQLGIEIMSRCKADHIQGILRGRVKYQSNPKMKAFIDDELFADNNTDAYAARVDLIVDQTMRGAIEAKGDHKVSAIIQELLGNGVYLNYDLKLGGDSFNIMSPGKRALALLRVLVELDTSQHPIVLDQPEDDLDNRSIYEGLAKYIKAKKEQRQIIVVTHNPNVVVGADSEYVIVANQSGQESNQDNRQFRFEYVYGGLEYSFVDTSSQFVLEKKGIRQHVCEILDGGDDAFRSREQLYSGRKSRKPL